MGITNRKQFIQLSVFDRLCRADEHGMIGGQMNDIDIVRRSVLRDVENLLNTRRKVTLPTAGFHHIESSFYLYGLKDFVAQNPKNPKVRMALKQNIEQTITKFEPRLINLSVDLNQEMGNEHHICFSVNAMLYADPVQEPIYFDTWFSVNRGEYKINNVK